MCIYLFYINRNAIAAFFKGPCLIGRLAKHFTDGAPQANQVEE